MTRIRPLIIVACLCTLAPALAVGGCLTDGAETGSSAERAAPPPPKPATLFLAPDGSNRGRCERSSPCRTLARAYKRARPGEVVELAAGKYEEQSIAPRGDLDHSSERVVFRPAEGAGASIERLSIEAGVQGVELQDVDFPDGWEVGPADEGAPALDIVFRRTTGSLFSIMNARDVSVIGGSYGPAVDAASTIKVYNPDNEYSPTDILIERVRFHDYTRSADDVHTECLQIYAGLRVTIRSNRFGNCEGTGALALTTVGSSSVRGVLVENNWIDDSDDAVHAVQADRSVEDLVFRYNSSMGSMAFTGECGDEGCGSTRVVANVLPWTAAQCADGVTYSRNLFEGGRCDPSDTEVSALGFADPARFDLHVTEDSPARCMGDPAAIPELDIDGEPRGRGRTPDAGADQLRAPAPLPSRCRLPGS